MRNLKKLVALIVTLALLATFAIPAFAATPADVKGTDYEGAVTRLAALGVINGYPDGTFGPNDPITRAQFAAVVVRALGNESLASTASGVTQFSDVPATHWASGYINIAVSLKIINGYGDGKFGPDDKVTFDQAVTMIVRALGAQAFADAKGGFPTGYLIMGKQLGFSNGVAGVAGVPATRGIVAQLIDNAKSIVFFEQTGFGDSQTYVQPTDLAKQHTFLTELGMTKIAGVVVTKTPDTSDVGANKFAVGATTYEAVAGAFDIEALLGKKVNLWTNGTKIVLAEVAAGTQIAVELVSYATDVDADADVDTVTVKDAAGTSTTYTVSSATGATNNLKADTIDNLLTALNPVKATTQKYSLTVTVDGTALLFAAGLKFDATGPITIGAPVVNNVNKSIKINANTAIKLGDKAAKKVVIVKDGAVVDYTALAAGDVVMIARNEDATTTDAAGDYFYIKATNKTAAGKLTGAKPSAAAATSVNIGGTFYSVSQWDADGIINAAALLDANVTAVLDPNGKIFSVTADAGATADKYGIIIGSDKESALGDTVYKVKLLTSSGDKITYTATSDATALTGGIANDGDMVGTLINYYVNADGNISAATVVGNPVADSVIDVDKYKYGATTYVKSDVIVFKRSGAANVGASYSVIKWTDILDGDSAPADASVTTSGEYAVLVLDAPVAATTTTANNYAYALDKTAIAGGKYVMDLFGKNGAASLTTTDAVYAAALDVFVYTINSTTNAITITNPSVAVDANAAIDEVSTTRIKIGNAYYYFKDSTVIIYDGGANGGTDVANLTKADLYKDMVVKVYSADNLDIDFLVVTSM